MKPPITALAQPATIRAAITGGGDGRGKCTFEGEIHGDRETIRQ